MKLIRLSMACCALAVAAGAPEPAAAAWNNVFQVTCMSCQQNQPAIANYAPTPVIAQSSPVVGQGNPCCDPCPQPCPQTQCTTSYIQRCYYQPVTSYQTQTYYEPVTTMRTSYYYEPCTSYRYSCYFDPCTCSYQKVAVPVTSYSLRAQQCPVTSYVQRCCSVPVTSYRRVCCWQPQTTCCTTSAPAAPCPATTAPAVTAPPAVTEQRNFQQNPPTVTEDRSGGFTPEPPPAGGAGGAYDQYPGNAPGGFQSNYQPKLSAPVPANTTTQPRPAAPAPRVQLDRFVQSPDNWIQGRIVSDDNAPRPNARLLFVNAGRQTSRQYVTTNSAGHFNVSLASGNWLVYIDLPDGRRIYHSRIDVEEDRTPFITLVSR